MLAVVVGGIVGAGIYIRPASIAQLLGSPTLILAVWLAGGILSLCGALTYAQLAMQIPGTGGEYLFLRTTLGRLPAFLYGWMRLTVGPAAIGAMAAAFISGIPIFAVLEALRRRSAEVGNLRLS